MLRNLGLLHEDNNDLTSAEADYRRALALETQASDDRDQSGMITTLEGLASVLAEEHLYDESVLLIRRSLNIRSRNNQMNTSQAVRALLTLGSTLYKLGRVEEVDIELSKALSTLEQLKLGESLDAATAMSLLAELMRSRDQPDEALKMYKRALEIREKILGSSNPENITVLNNLGLTYVDLKQYRDAIDSYQKALVLAQKAYGTNSHQSKVIKDNVDKAQELLSKRNTN